MNKRFAFRTNLTERARLLPDEAAKSEILARAGIVDADQGSVREPSGRESCVFSVLVAVAALAVIACGILIYIRQEG